MSAGLGLVETLMLVPPHDADLRPRGGERVSLNGGIGVSVESVASSGASTSGSEEEGVFAFGAGCHASLLCGPRMCPSPSPFPNTDDLWGFMRPQCSAFSGLEEVSHTESTPPPETAPSDEQNSPQEPHLAPQSQTCVDLQQEPLGVPLFSPGDASCRRKVNVGRGARPAAVAAKRQFVEDEDEDEDDEMMQRRKARRRACNRRSAQASRERKRALSADLQDRLGVVEDENRALRMQVERLETQLRGRRLPVMPISCGTAKSTALAMFSLMIMAGVFMYTAPAAGLVGAGAGSQRGLTVRRLLDVDMEFSDQSGQMPMWPMDDFAPERAVLVVSRSGTQTSADLGDVRETPECQCMLGPYSFVHHHMDVNGSESEEEKDMATLPACSSVSLDSILPPCRQGSATV